MISLQSLYNSLPSQKVPENPSEMIYTSFELYENIPKELTLFDKVVDNRVMNEEMKRVNETASINKVVKIDEVMAKVNFRENLVHFVVRDKFVDCVKEVSGIYDKNVVKKDSFLMALFSLLKSDFLYMDSVVKENILIQIRTLIASHLVDKDLYKKFGYDINSKFSKTRLQNELMDFKNNSDECVNSLLGQFLADYLQLDIVIFREESKSLKYFIASKFDHESGDIPFVSLLLTKANYYVSLRTGEDGIFKWSEEVFRIEKPSRVNIDMIRKEKMKKKELENIEISEELTVKKVNELLESDLKKLKMDELKKLLDERGISLLKKSDKTNKDIKKTKQDMIDDLLC